LFTPPVSLRPRASKRPPRVWRLQFQYPLELLENLPFDELRALSNVEEE
jgi:hypothetical protein